MNWDEYFMNIAIAVSQRSKDPETKVGTVIVNVDKHIISTGYNGMFPGVTETPDMWLRPTKYDLVIHSEANAICHTSSSLKGCTLYSSMYPCKECSKLIAASGINRVFYRDPKYKNDVSEKIFSMCNITVKHI